MALLTDLPPEIIHIIIMHMAHHNDYCACMQAGRIFHILSDRERELKTWLFTPKYNLMSNLYSHGLIYS